MKQEIKTLGDYMHEKRLSVIQFCRMCNITADPIYKHRNETFIPMTNSTQRKINIAWQKKYGEQLLPHMYTDFNN